jgi:ABC-type multidrug transport system ATPase subunit
MQTMISEGQGGISGGQKQRLLIARAIAPKPNVLIFDEATSALDNLTQRKVTEALDSYKCTRIVIAHRLSTIQACDRILLLRGGKIEEDGTYDELLERKGFFSELVERQRLDTGDSSNEEPRDDMPDGEGEYPESEAELNEGEYPESEAELNEGEYPESEGGMNAEENSEPYDPQSEENGNVPAG